MLKSQRFCKAFMLMAALAAVTPLGRASAPAPAKSDNAYRQYLQLLENFAGWAEQHWNEQEQCYNAKGAGVTWARGNGDVCLVYAVLLTELSDRPMLSPRKIPRQVILDHVQRTLRTICLRNKNCTNPQAVKPPTWGGPTWQSALETEHWAFAARLLTDQLDDRTKALVRQVATAEADNSKNKRIPGAKKGDTAADDCCWDAGVLGVVAAIYADEPRAASWNESAKRWALNVEAREADWSSSRLIDGKPLREWIVSTNVYPDLTLENHGFWDLPYQVCFAALVEPALAYQVCGEKISEAFYAHAREEGENILKWMTLPDGDLLCPQGLDWAERDVQHSWAFTELGTLLDLSWARAAEERCLKLLTDRQKAFGDGALHANDFGYETDLANCWAFSCLLHKYFGKPGAGSEFREPSGSKLFPYVSVAVYRTPNLVSSVTWFRSRQAVMIVPNNPKPLGNFPSFTAYRGDPRERQISGLGHIRLQGEQKPQSFRVDGEPQISQENERLTVSFNRSIPGVATQKVGYCALPTGQVLVFSQWQALKDIEIAELVDHPFYWVAIPGYLPARAAKAKANGVWSIDNKLQMQVLGGAGGTIEKQAVLGSVRRTPWTAKAGELLQDSVCIYQPEIPGRTPALASGDTHRVALGEWTVERGDESRLYVNKSQTTSASR
jgi:hypothetical protein